MNRDTFGPMMSPSAGEAAACSRRTVSKLAGALVVALGWSTSVVAEAHHDVVMVAGALWLVPADQAAVQGSA